MTGLRARLGRAAGRMTLGVITMAAAAALMAPPVFATPDSEAADAIDQAWQAAGGDDSSLGAKDGDVYPIGDGYAQNFSGGKMFFTPATGAHLLYGAVLDKYTELGGPADSDLGFPTLDEVPGLVGPDSRVSTFSAADKPAIFWTPDTGAWVVRGAMNIAWDKLGGSAGILGVPVADETYDGDVIDQKFTGGEVSWNSSTKAFTTVPPDLAAQLDGVEVPMDATTAINQAWRAAGGFAGPMGARQGGQSTVGDGGVVQAYAGGKIYYTPSTGAHAVTGAILSKYESSGGPTGDLGFPVATEGDGGAPNSRVTVFSASDKPVIFWTPDNGAIIVRGAINAAWTKLGGAAGKLGVPTSERSVDGDTITQKFSGGEISWNQDTNTFSTKPADLAASLSGLDVPKAPPGTAAAPHSDKGFTWHWWWLLVIIPVLMLIALVGLGLMRVRRRRAVAMGERDVFGDAGYDDGARWSGGRSWAHPGGEVGKAMPGPEDIFDGDQDSVDTTPTRIPGGSRSDRDEVAIDDEHDDEDLDQGRDRSGDHEGERSSGAGRHSTRARDDADAMWTLNIDQIREQLRRRAEEATAEEQRRDAVDEDRAADDEDDDFAEGLDGEPARRADDSEDSAGRADDEECDDAQDDAQDDAHDDGEDRAGDDDAGEDEEESDDQSADAGRPAIHLPLADPYRAPEGYPIKANTHSGLYYTPDCDLYDDTVPEVWFASEELAQANGFMKAE